MEVVSTSPDTGQHGGCAPACSRDVHALAGKPGRTLCPLSIMTIRVLFPRLAALALAVACVPLSVQAQSSREAPAFQTVQVSANRFDDSASDLPFGVSVITSSDIQRSGASTVNEALMRVLGVPGRQDFYGGGDYALDLRGFGTTSDSNQVIMVDGQRLSEADLGGTRLSGIPIDTVERIEVIRGSGAVLYGEGASGGVIIITTKAGKGVARRNAARAYTAAGSRGLVEARAGATLVAGGFSLDVDGNRRQADNHRANFKSDQGGVAATAQWSNDWLRLGARHADDRLDTGLPGSLTAAQYAADPYQTTTPNNKAQIENQRNSLFAEAQLGDWQLGMDAGTRRKKLYSYSPSYITAYEIEADTLSLRARHETRLGTGRNIVQTGWDQADWKRVDGGSGNGQRDQQSRGIYLKNDYVWGTGTRLSAGLRREQIDKQVRSTSTNGRVDERPQAWELGLLQPLAPSTSVYGRVGRSFRVANVDEFGFTIPGVSLRPQISRDTELGVRWGRSATALDLRVYRSALTDEIGYDGLADGPYGAGTGANVNFDPTERKGLELEARHAWSRSLQLRLNTALRDARFVGGSYAGRDVPLVPSQTLALRADWTPQARHQLSGGLNWVSSRHPDLANRCTMPSYTTLDLRYAYQLRQVELALGVNNLADRSYYTQAFSCSNGQVSSIYPEAGRTVVASARLSF